MYDKYYPSVVFFMSAPHLYHSDKKLGGLIMVVIRVFKAFKELLG